MIAMRTLLLGTLAASALAGGPRIETGRPAPAFAVTTIDGQKLDLQQWRGKRVLVFMWASW